LKWSLIAFLRAETSYIFESFGLHVDVWLVIVLRRNRAKLKIQQ